MALAIKLNDREGLVRVTTLSRQQMTTLQGEVMTLPKDARIETLGFKRLGDTDFHRCSIDKALYDLPSLRAINDQLVKHARAKGDMSVCGFKLPLVWSKLRITMPGQKPVEICAIAQALMVIPDSPLHRHGRVVEKYTILKPTEWRKLCRALHKNGIQERLTGNGFMVSGDTMENLDVMPVSPNQEIPIKVGLIHGFGAPERRNQKTGLLVVLNFYPGLVPKEIEGFPKELLLHMDSTIDPKLLRDEQLMGQKAREARAALLT